MSSTSPTEMSSAEQFKIMMDQFKLMNVKMDSATVETNSRLDALGAKVLGFREELKEDIEKSRSEFKVANESLSKAVLDLQTKTTVLETRLHDVTNSSPRNSDASSVVGPPASKSLRTETLSSSPPIRSSADTNGARRSSVPASTTRTSTATYAEAALARKSLRLGGFHFNYSRTSLNAFAPKYIEPIIAPLNMSDIKVHSSGMAKSVVIEFPCATSAGSFLDRWSTMDPANKIFVEPDTEEQFELTLKWNASDAIRRMGSLMTILWEIAAIKIKAVPNAPNFCFRTDRAVGRFNIVLGHRIVTLFKVDLINDNPVLVLDRDTESRLPTWLPIDILNLIVTEVMKSPKWR